MSNESTEQTEDNYDGFALTWAVEAIATRVLDLVRADTHNIGDE